MVAQFGRLFGVAPAHADKGECGQPMTCLSEVKGGAHG